MTHEEVPLFVYSAGRQEGKTTWAVEQLRDNPGMVMLVPTFRRRREILDRYKDIAPTRVVAAPLLDSDPLALRGRSVIVDELRHCLLAFGVFATHATDLFEVSELHRLAGAEDDNECC